LSRASKRCQTFCAVGQKPGLDAGPMSPRTAPPLFQTRKCNSCCELAGPAQLLSFEKQKKKKERKKERKKENKERKKPRERKKERKNERRERKKNL
jgi:hypothetical protein